MGKSNGQILYEYKSPEYFKMIGFENRHFASSRDCTMIKNDNHVPWKFLTKTCQDSWEVSAKGHYLFSDRELT